MAYEIPSRYTQDAVYRSDKAGDLRDCVIEAVKSGANLSGANLSGANLYGASLSRANLSGANLSGANLYGANLYGASLSGAKINWMSHGLIAVLLFRAAGDSVSRRQIAGLVAVSTDWCWEQFLAIRLREKKWALDTLAEYVQDGDNAPDALWKRAKKTEEAK